MDINKLPKLVINNLLNYFNINERSVLAEVGFENGWEQQIEHLDETTNSVCIYTDSKFPYGKRWLVSNKLIGYSNSFQVQAKFDQTKISNSISCEKIKKLCVLSAEYRWILNQNFLSNFDQLEHLELDSILLTKRMFEIDLPKLRSLSINNLLFCKLELNTPNLQVLILNLAKRSVIDDNLHRFNRRHLDRRDLVDNFNQIEFTSSTELQHLQCAIYPPEIENLTINKLKSINCGRLDESQEIMLENLPALQLFQIAEKISSSIKENLQTQKLQLNRTDLNLVYLDFKKYSFKQSLNDFYYFINGKNVINNLSQSNIMIPYKVCLYYNGFAELFDKNSKNQLISLLNKMTNIFKVEVFKVTDQQNLLDFLHLCGQFRILELYYSSVDQKFYDQLAFFKSINHLKIKETHWTIQNYDFLSQLIELKSLYVYYDALTFDIEHIFEFIQHAFENCANLKQFKFGRKFFKVNIKKRDKKSFQLRIPYSQSFEGYFDYKVGLDQLVDQLESLKDKLKESILIPIKF